MSLRVFKQHRGTAQKACFNNAQVGQSSVFVIMSAVHITTLVVSALLGAFLTAFTVLNLVADIGNPFGSFGVKFIYEMDIIMGGQLA